MSDSPPPQSSVPPLSPLPGGRLQHPLQVLSALVVRDRVGLGGLPAPVQEAVLGLLWTGLPDETADERQVNTWLQAQLAGPALFLHTDHVELRRRLVDAGWLTRDAWGRAYRRSAVEQLDAAQREVVRALAGTDTVSWVASQRAAQAATRLARRTAWQARVLPEPESGEGGTP